MRNIRIIPCLDVDNGRVVKGTGFKNIREVGDPVKLAERYYREGADEITFLDIGATCKSRKILIDYVEEASRKVFIPLTVGGGLRSVDDMRSVLRSGADKISICSSALLDPQLITEAAQIFGSQCIVISIDAKRVGSGWNAFRSGGRINTGIDAVKFAVEAQRRGAGEILLNSIDNDGTQKGYDTELIKKVSQSVSVPVIASGGAGKLEDLESGVKDGKADALLLASLLHDEKMSIKQIKQYLKEKEVSVRC